MAAINCGNCDTNTDNVVEMCLKLRTSVGNLIDKLGTGQCSIQELKCALTEAHQCNQFVIESLSTDTAEYKEQFKQYAIDIKRLIIETMKKEATCMTRTIASNQKPSVMDLDVAKQQLEKYAYNSESQGFTDVCGMTEILQKLRVMFILPMRQPQLYADHTEYNTILLYGPPGCGKTQLVHAFSKEIKANLYCITAGTIMSKFVGESEKTLLHVFENIRKLQTTSILFIDEVDAFCRKRTCSEDEHSRRLKTEFLNQLTMKSLGCKTIIIGATNVPWDIDNAVMRRFQKHLFLGLPNRLERSDLINFYLKNVKLEVDDSINAWNCLLDKTHGYSNSDLKELVRCASHKPIEELTKLRFWSLENGMYYYASDLTAARIDSISSVYDLPAGSVKARDPSIHDLIASIDEVPRTVSDVEIASYDHFNNNRHN